MESVYLLNVSVFYFSSECHIITVIIFGVNENTFFVEINFDRSLRFDSITVFLSSRTLIVVLKLK